MVFQIRRATNGNYYFRVLASNGQVLCHSEGYTQKQSCLHAIGLIQSQASRARVVDTTRAYA